MVVDPEGWIQEATLIKKGRYPNYIPGEFEFNVKKVEGLSPFQKKVYTKLVKVPAGKTISYKDLGVKAGYENAARAVGAAMAKNKVILFIPCHRVVQSSGGLGNYSGHGGVDTKQLLLNFEESGGSI